MRSDLNRFLGFGTFSLMLCGAVGPAEAACPSSESVGFVRAERADTTPVTVVKRVTQAKLTPAQARRITMMNPVLSLVTISGVTIRPIPGNSLWKLTHGAYAIFDSEPTVNAMQVWTKDMGDGDLYIRACLCPGYNPNVDDGCKFSNATSPTNPGECAGNLCCDTIEGVILGDGTPIAF